MDVNWMMIPRIQNIHIIMKIEMAIQNPAEYPSELITEGTCAIAFTSLLGNVWPIKSVMALVMGVKSPALPHDFGDQTPKDTRGAPSIYTAIKTYSKSSFILHKL